MPSTAFLAPVAGNRWVRRAADAVLLRYAHHRAVALDRMDAGKVQHDTLLTLVRRARNTRFGRDHDFARIDSVADYQARVPVRDYECFWNTYWKDAYPRLDDITWPGMIPYYALSSRHHERRDEVHPRVVGDGAVEQEGRVHDDRAVPAREPRPRSSSPASSSSSAAAPTCASRPTAASRAT